MFTTSNINKNSTITEPLNHPNTLTDNLAPDVTIQSNTNFMEQRITDSQTAYPSTKIQLPQSIEDEMADGTWLAKSQLMKPVQIGQATWSITQPRNTNLFDFSFPGILQSIDSLATRTLSMYSFYKLAPCFRIQINSTQFHQGQLICSFDPFSLTKVNPTTDVFSYVYATGLPHVRIMASESDAVELKIPFIHPRSFLTTNSQNYNNLGNFYVTIMNPLNVAEGSTPNVTVTVWMYALDAEVHVPIAYHNPILEPALPTLEATSQMSKEKNNIKMNQNLVKETQPQSRSFGEIGGGIFDKGLKIFGNLLTGNVGQALRTGQGLIDDFGELLGFDYPVDPINPQKFIMPVENMSVGVGKSRAQRMAINPMSLHAVPDDIASESLKAMNLKQVIQIPMLINSFEFNSTLAQNTLIHTHPIHPQISAQIPNIGVQRSYLSYVSNAFTYWSGGIKYDIEIVATRFHSGKLLFAYVPNVRNIPDYEEASTSLPNVIVDIQQTSNTTFTVPFTSSTAMKSTLLKVDSTPNEYVDSATGFLVCYVQNALTFASNVTPKVEINIYQYAAEDFKLYVPRRFALNIPAPALVALEPTTGISIMESTNMGHKTSATLSKDQSLSKARFHFGEDYNLLDIIRRYSLQTFYDYQVPDNENFISFALDVSPSPNSDDPETDYLDSYLNYFARIYSAWSGSLRYKFIFNSNRISNSTFTISHHPDPVHLDFIDQERLTVDLYPLIANNGYSVVRTNLAQDNALEIEVPYYSKYNMLLTRDIDTYYNQPTFAEYSNNGNLFTVLCNTLEKASEFADIYVSAGEDFRFIYLRPPGIDSSVGLDFTTVLA